MIDNISEDKINSTNCLPLLKTGILIFYPIKIA
jgi:hypothetical protein